MRFAQAKCKFCGGSATAQWEDADPQEAVDRFIPMIACNPCADAYRQRNDSGSEIVSNCYRLSRASKKERAEIVGDIRTALVVLTRTYAYAMMHILRSQSVLWSEDFAQRLIESPEKASEILRQYRAEVRRMAKQGIAA